MDIKEQLYQEEIRLAKLHRTHTQFKKKQTILAIICATFMAGISSGYMLKNNGSHPDHKAPTGQPARNTIKKLVPMLFNPQANYPTKPSCEEIAKHITCVPIFIHPEGNKT